MNAYELADDVKNISNTIEALEWVQKATPLLRQQADRIAELEKQLNTPKTYVLDGKQIFDTSPQIKELSDEEIYKLAEYHGLNDWLYETSVPDFARAILKKANEK